MSNKHTPGPWFVGEPIGQNDGGPKVGIVRCDGPGLAERWVAKTNGWFPGTRDADAQLIAAAPELLEACREALAVLAYANTDGSTEALLAAAIAKATGGAK